MVYPNTCLQDQLQKRIGRMSDSDFSRSAKHLDKKSSSSGSVSLDKIPRDGPVCFFVGFRIICFCRK